MVSKEKRVGLPLVESYVFGVTVCTYCARQGWLVRHRLKDPIYADRARTEVLIPAGAQMFHVDCLNQVLDSEPFTTVLPGAR